MILPRLLGHLNPVLRSVATWLPAESRLRRRASALWGAILDRNHSDVAVSLHGIRVLLAPKWRSLDPRYERRALGSFLAALRPGNTVWDVGGHVGLYSVLAAKRVGSSGRVVAWEPSPLSFAELRHHLQINGVADRCRAINEGIAECAKEIEFAVDVTAPDSSTNRILHQVVQGTSRVLRLQANTLDHWAESLGQVPDVMKMDIEGAEWFALRGATRLLTAGKRPRILLSAHPASIWQYGGNVAELDRLVRDAGYQPLSLTGRPATIDDFAEYWLIPGGEAEAFARFLTELEP